MLGAGSVGVGTALHLQQRGWNVTLVDKAKPASETSFGNAGVINASSFLPLNNHTLWKSLPRYLRNNQPQIRYSWARVLAEFPWLFYFLRYANSRATQETSAALNQLCSEALNEHRAFMQRAGNMHRLTQNGWLKVLRQSKGFDPNGLEGRLFEQFGVGVQPLTAEEVYELEPSLNRIFSGGYLLTDSASVNNPFALINEYVNQFSIDGGTVVETDVRSVSFDGSQFTLHGDNLLHTENLVVAAGPWSADVLKPLGYRAMLGVERGYHQHFHPQDGAQLNRTVYDLDAGYIMAPMEAGIRITSGVELARRDAPTNTAQLEQVIPRAYEAFPLSGPTKDPIWRGARPTFPDSRPVIDKAPAHENLWLAFGHQHIGLMSGPITGKLLAQVISGEKTDIDLNPFKASRWIRHSGR